MMGPWQIVTACDDALRDMARQVLADVRYLVLGTTEADGRSRVSPV